jgi:hypothetical protein
MKQEKVVRSAQVRAEEKAGVWTGTLMVLVGVLFLLSTSGFSIAGYSPTMLIALVPIYWIGVAAYRRYREEGGFTRHVLSIAIFAVLPLAVMAAMVLGYSISGLWPLGAIVVGISFVLHGSK